jgi:hypothetical protein
MEPLFFLNGAPILLHINYQSLKQFYMKDTDYVREEFNRAASLESEGRRGTVGFALTILQRRLASSPEAIYQSIKRRRERLENRLREEELLKRGAESRFNAGEWGPTITEDDIDDLEEMTDAEVEETEEKIIDLATAAQTIAELHAEISTLKGLEELPLNCVEALGIKNGKKCPNSFRKMRRCSTLQAPVVRL